MQTFKLPSPNPEAGTDVTRLWLASGLARVGAVLGNTIQFNGVGLCWDTLAQRAIWEADLQDADDTYPDPDFDRDLTRVVYTRQPNWAEGQRADLGVRDIASGAERRLDGPWAHRPAIAPDGRYAYAVVVPGRDRAREVRRWSLPSSFETTVRGPTDEIAPDRNWAIRLPNPRGHLRQLDALLNVLAVSPDGKQLAGGRYDGALVVWKVAGRREVMTAPAAKKAKYLRYSAHRLAFAPDGSRLAAVRRRVNRRYEFEVSVWTVTGGERQKGPKEKVSVNGVAFSPDGRTLLTAREDGTVGVWHTATWKLRREYAWKIGKLFSVAFAPDGLTCAAGGENGHVVVWDVDT